MAFEIGLTEEAWEHLQQLTARQRSTLIARIEEQLTWTPTTETRNKKPLRANSIAPWELRIGVLRVYYDVFTDPDDVVEVVAIGIKERNLVRIGSKLVQP